MKAGSASDEYDDGATGGNMDRPALKRLMNDIKNGLIDTVVVYKVDRCRAPWLILCRVDLFDGAKCPSFPLPSLTPPHQWAD